MTQTRSLSLCFFCVCLYQVIAQNNEFGRFEFNFNTLLTLPNSGQSQGNLNIPEDPPLSCPPKPTCPLRGDKFYHADGSCNNLIDGTRGQAGRPHKRLMPAAYADGRGQPRRGSNGRELPSARVISTGMQSSSTRKSTKNTHLLVIFCQFITHDITNTPTINRDGFGVDCRCRSRDPACFNVEVPSNDRQVVEEGKFCLPVVRSQPVPDANCNTRIRQQQNIITPYLDAGTVYGASDFQMGQLLNQSSPIGELKTGHLFPYGRSPPNSPSLPLVTLVHHTLREIECPLDVHKPKGTPCFVAGDARANENPALASFHTLFVRMHNDLVRGLNRVNPQWNKMRLIHTARNIMSAVTQRIMYKQFLPELLGSTYMERFSLSVLDEGYWHGYDSSYDATTSTEFISAALRFGHTLVTSPLVRRSPQWNRQGSNMELKDSFFDSTSLLNSSLGGANSILRGLCQEASETTDTTFVDDLHNFLFAPQGRLGHDLLAINLQRGRDHGMAGYNSYREFCGLVKARTFSDFVEIPPNDRRRLQRLYSNRVDDVDLYVAGLAETPVPDGLFGPTFSCILAYQFRDIKKGDRLWHENGGEFSLFTPEQLGTIRDYTMSRLICDTMTDTQTLQPNPFQLIDMPGNSRIPCSQYPPLNLGAWSEARSNPLRTDTRPEETSWFPAEVDNKVVTVQELLGYLLEIRPADVCEATLGFVERTINRNEQYRFLCPPGSIRGTDFPNVDSSKGLWGEWEDASTPGVDDDESRSADHPCVEPIAIQVLTQDSGVPARETGDVFRSFSITSGFVCLGKDQESGQCQDYKVRYFCRRIRPVNQPPPADLRWTQWISTDTPNNFGDDERLSRVANRVGFCRNPVAIQARTIRDQRSAESTGAVFSVFSASQGLQCLHAEQTRFFFPVGCLDYEVRYRCRASDINQPSAANLPPQFRLQQQNLCNFFQVCCV